MFQSFLLAGFDGSTGRNKAGRWFDHVVATGHDRLAVEDYAAISALGIRGAREAVRWPLVDRGRGAYDFATVRPFIEAASKARVDVIWDLFHYGYPDQLDLLSADFPRRFADYCYAVARYIGSHTDGSCWFTPVNEPSFMAYAAGEAGLFAPWLQGRGWDLKVALAEAALRGIEAIWAACPGARIVNVDPICRTVAPDGRDDLAAAAQHFNDTLVFQAWDILCGRLLPELGGSPAHLDIIGINYYWTNQWEFGAAPGPDGAIPPLGHDDPRRLPLNALIRSAWQRYRCDVLISETAHIGDHRAPWISELALEAGILVRDGVPLRGVCLFPIVAMPAWHEPEHWPEMGLWEPSCRREPHTGRIVCAPVLDAVRQALHATKPFCSAAGRMPLRKPLEKSGEIG